MQTWLVVTALHGRVQFSCVGVLNGWCIVSPSCVARQVSHPSSDYVTRTDGAMKARTTSAHDTTDRETTARRALTLAG